MHIHFIQTGGSIDKNYPKFTKGYAFEITDPAVNDILDRVKPSFTFEVTQLLKKDSQDMTESDRELLAATIQIKT